MGVAVTLNYTSSAADLAEWYETKQGVGQGDVVGVSRDFIEYDTLNAQCDEYYAKIHQLRVRLLKGEVTEEEQAAGNGSTR
jgi:hypothetical protein